jgi:DNA-binding NarL/FixJ family response regulator
LETSKIRILVVDDYDRFRRFISSAFSHQPNFQVIGEVSDGLEAVQKAQELQPDLILLDVGLPTLNGIEAARRIRRLSPDSKILFASQQSSPDLVQVALDTGALGYVLKSDAAGELLPAVEAALRGKLFVSSSLAAHDSIKAEDGLTGGQAGRQKVVPHSRPTSAGSNRHELSLYSDDAAFVDDFAHSIGAALEDGNAVVIIATESHRANLLQQLRSDGVDIDVAAERKLYIPLDVSDSLPRVMETLAEEDGIAKDVPQAIVEALRTAQERHLHLAIG